MRKIRDKGIAKLAAQAHRAQKAKRSRLNGTSSHPKPRGFKKRRRLGKKGKAKASVVMREFYHGELTSHGRRVPRSRPDIGKAIAMSEARAADKPKRRRRRRRKSAKRAPVTHKRRVARVAAPKARRPSHRRKSPRRAASKATRRSPKSAKPHKTKSAKKPSAKQLAARKHFVQMVKSGAFHRKKR
jgi:hypothetical protein